MNPIILAEGDLFSMFEIVKQYGPFCGTLLIAVVFFIWRDWKREEKLTKRIAVLEDETRNILLPLIKDCTVVVARNTLVMERLEKHLND